MMFTTKDYICEYLLGFLMGHGGPQVIATMHLFLVWEYYVRVELQSPSSRVSNLWVPDDI